MGLARESRSYCTPLLGGVARFDLPQVTDGFVVAGLAKLSSLDRRDPDQLLRLADLVSLVVFDEAHQAVATTYASLVSLLHGKRPTTRLLGLTATPGRTWSDIPEDQRLADFFGQDNKVVLTIDGYDNPVTFLIGAGYLSRPRFRTLTPSTGVRLTASALHALSAAVDVPLSTLTTLGEDILRNVAIVKEVEPFDATAHPHSCLCPFRTERADGGDGPLDAELRVPCCHLPPRRKTTGRGSSVAFGPQLTNR